MQTLLSLSPSLSAVREEEEEMGKGEG